MSLAVTTLILAGQEGSRPMKFAKLLVPLDGSALAETALPTAIQLAKEQGGSLSLVRAVEAWGVTSDVVEAEIRVVREAEQYLAKLADLLRANGYDRVDTSVWYGAPARSIVDAASAHKADLIVMTSHGRGGISRLIMGSVAESVLRGTRTPILLLRAGGAGVSPPDGRTQRVRATANGAVA